MKRILVELSDSEFARLKLEKGKRTWLDMLSRPKNDGLTKAQISVIQSMIDESLEAFEVKLRGR